MKTAFIYLSVGCSATETHTELMYPGGILHLYGVASLDEACSLAADLCNAGFEALELCGGFGPDRCRTVWEAVGKRIPVGYIAYLPENEHQRALLPKDESRHMDWAYIFVDPSCEAGKTYAKLTYRNGSRDIHLYGVPSVERGLAHAEWLVQEKGYPLIEFSRDFGAENCRKCVSACGDSAFIGYVSFLSE